MGGLRAATFSRPEPSTRFGIRPTFSGAHRRVLLNRIGWKPDARKSNSKLWRSSDRLFFPRSGDEPRKAHFLGWGNPSHTPSLCTWSRLEPCRIDCLNYRRTTFHVRASASDYCRERRACACSVRRPAAARACCCGSVRGICLIRSRSAGWICEANCRPRPNFSSAWPPAWVFRSHRRRPSKPSWHIASDRCGSWWTISAFHTTVRSKPCSDVCCNILLHRSAGGWHAATGRPGL
ncbi:hypothetical protein D3C81_1500400 [compost metagenome]